MAALIAPPAYAFDLTPAGSAIPRAMTQLDIAHQRAEWRYEDRAISATETDELAITFAERITASTLGGIDIGIASGHQNNRAATDDFSFSGSLLGAHTHSKMPLALGLTGVLNLSYRFYYLRETTTTTTARWQWHNWQAGVGVLAPLSESFTLHANVAYHYISGYEDIVINNSTSANADFSSEKESVLSLGLNWHVDPSGNVGLRYSRGAIQGWQLSFSRAY